jgi:microcystin-dependent protein
MKKLLTTLALAFTFCCLSAQAPASFNFQSVLRNPEGSLLSNKEVTITFSIYRSSDQGNPLYTEAHTVMTNPLALVNVSIGTGSTSDDFSAIDWAKGPFSLNINVDGNEAGTTQLQSVPYALYAQHAGQVDETDPLFSGSPAQQITDAGSGMVITTDERNTLAQAVVVDGPLVEGNLISYDGNNWVASDLMADPVGQNQPVNNMQPYLGVNYIIALQGIFPSRSGIEPFIAEIIMFGGNFAPRGWAFCDGQLLPIAQNQALFSILGTTYGGDGRTTFALPDLRGRAAIHPGTGPGLSTRQLGERGGTETNTLTLPQLPTHTHTIRKQ